MTSSPQQRQKVPFQDLELGQKFWNEMGVSFQKNGRTSLEVLSGDNQGKIFDQVSVDSLVYTQPLEVCY